MLMVAALKALDAAEWVARKHAAWALGLIDARRRD
jgi:hypothetical protein